MDMRSGAALGHPQRLLSVPHCPDLEEGGASSLTPPLLVIFLMDAHHSRNLQCLPTAQEDTPASQQAPPSPCAPSMCTTYSPASLLLTRLQGLLVPRDSSQHLSFGELFLPVHGNLEHLCGRSALAPTSLPQQASPWAWDTGCDPGDGAPWPGHLCTLPSA